MRASLLFIAFLVGCSSSSTTPSPANGEHECERYESTACEVNVVCGISTFAACQAQLVSSGADCTKAPWSTATVDPALTDACVVAIHAATCAQVKDPNSKLPAACMTWAAQYKGQ